MTTSSSSTNQVSKARGHNRTHRFKVWIIEHDERWSFLVIYVVLAVLLTLWIGMFWLFIVVAGHFVFEMVKKRHDGCAGWTRTVVWSLWDMKFDLALVAWALVLLTYTSASFGIVGASTAGRLFMLGKGNPAFWRNLLIVSRVVIVRKADRLAKLRMVADAPCPVAARAERLQCAHYPWQQPLRWYDFVCLGLTGLCLLAIGFAPLVVDESAGELALEVLRHLHPFPS